MSTTASCVILVGRIILPVGIFCGGVAVGTLWGDRLPLLAKRTEPQSPPSTVAKAEPPPSGEKLLADVAIRLGGIQKELALCERDEQEATIAANLIRKQTDRSDAETLREQEQLRGRAVARKTELVAEREELLKLQSELFAAMADEKLPEAPRESDLPTRVRTFVIRQDLLRDPSLPVPGKK